jgi:hypothetical protein
VAPDLAARKLVSEDPETRTLRPRSRRTALACKSLLHLIELVLADQFSAQQTTEEAREVAGSNPRPPAAERPPRFLPLEQRYQERHPLSVPHKGFTVCGSQPTFFMQ